MGVEKTEVHQSPHKVRCPSSGWQALHLICFSSTMQVKSQVPTRSFSDPPHTHTYVYTHAWMCIHTHKHTHTHPNL